ncbi:MAG: hypothetical protein MHM6MM_003791, partial [Cercozoa sp. M6MM]
MAIALAVAAQADPYSFSYRRRKKTRRKNKNRRKRKRNQSCCQRVRHRLRRGFEYILSCLLLLLSPVIFLLRPVWVPFVAPRKWRQLQARCDRSDAEIRRLRRQLESRVSLPSSQTACAVPGPVSGSVPAPAPAPAPTGVRVSVAAPPPPHAALFASIRESASAPRPPPVSSMPKPPARPALKLDFGSVKLRSAGDRAPSAKKKDESSGAPVISLAALSSVKLRKVDRSAPPAEKKESGPRGLGGFSVSDIRGVRLRKVQKKETLPSDESKEESEEAPWADRQQYWRRRNSTPASPLKFKKSNFGNSAGAFNPAQALMVRLRDSGIRRSPGGTPLDNADKGK